MPDNFFDKNYVHSKETRERIQKENLEEMERLDKEAKERSKRRLDAIKYGSKPNG
jgi:maleate cis-trans isomerase